MKIIKENKFSKLVTENLELKRKLDTKFAIPVPGHQFTKLFQKKRWDGKRHFFSLATGRFPTGLLHEVLAELKKLGEFAEVESKVRRPRLRSELSESLYGITLRGYQEKAADAIVEAGSCIVKAATNAGKTEVMAEVIRRAGIPTVVLVQRKELLYQTAERLSARLGIDVGVVGDGKRVLHHVTVALPSSLMEKVGKVYKVRSGLTDLVTAPLLFYDECHNIGDTRVQKFLDAAEATWRVALSGTPFGEDEINNYTLKSHFGRVAFEITNSELIDLGVSATPKCRFVKVEEPGIERAPYPVAYKVGVVSSEKRNEVITSLASHYSEHQNKSVLVIVREIEHGAYLDMQLPNGEFIHGGLDAETRINALRRFAAGDLKVLVASTILDEGVDVPNIEVCILACGGKTSKRVLQRIGRGLRKKEVNELLVVDFLDTGNKYLLDHSMARLNTMRAEGFDTKLWKEKA